jgi:DNA-binding NarL/FixJ family response regulator
MPNLRYVVIVDDHAMFRKGIEVLINMFPSYRVLFTASDGIDLKRQLNPQQLPDIILMDISMPEMGGYESAEYLRVNYPSIKVLALSTIESESAIIKMIRHGAKGYILKDAEPAELKTAFDEVESLGYYYNDIITRKVMRSINHLVDEKNHLPLFASLSERELQFLKLICSEKKYTQIAREMFVSERTVDGYRDALFKKLDLNSRVGLVIFAIKNRLVEI